MLGTLLPALSQPAQRLPSPGRQRPTPTRNVRDFGAVGDGKTDDTEAFNRAASADDPWSWDHLSSIRVPAGRYRIGGTVYLRKGQSLIGDGLSTYIDASGARTSTFVLGRRRTPGGRGEEDPGGLPVRIESLFGLGGAAGQGFIFAAIPGFQIASLFLSAVGIGIEIEAADGIISDVEIDQCLMGLRIVRSQNLVLSNLNVYLANYAVEMAGDVRDVSIANSLFCYTKHAAILLSGERIQALTLNGCTFTNNVQWPTFEAFIHNRASTVSATATGCTFRNWSGWAVDHGMGVDVDWRFEGCTFDGRPTNPVYDRSSAAAGIHAAAGHYRFGHCDFRALAGPLARLRAGLGSLTMEGGSIDGAGPRLEAEAPPGGPVRIRGMRGFVPPRDASGAVTLPRLPQTSWRIAAAGNGQAGEWIAGPAAGGGIRTLWASAAETPRIAATDTGIVCRLPAAFGAQPEVSADSFP